MFEVTVIWAKPDG
jgi:hypothetical protein